MLYTLFTDSLATITQQNLLVHLDLAGNVRARGQEQQKKKTLLVVIISHEAFPENNQIKCRQ